MITARKSYVGIFSLLLDREANVDTALCWAARFGQEAVCKVLLEKVNAKNNNGSMALRLAAEHGHEDICKLLLDREAEVDAKDKNKETALMKAARKGYEGICSLLLDRGADVNAKDEKGWTILMHAAYNGHIGVCKLLLMLNEGAEVDAKDNVGRTVLMLTARPGYEDISSLLLERGARIDIKDDESGLTALEIAKKNGLGSSPWPNQGFILPQADVEMLRKFCREAKTMFLVFNRKQKELKTSRDIRYYILSIGWKKEIRNLIKHLIYTGRSHLFTKYFQGLKNKIVLDSLRDTFSIRKGIEGVALEFYFDIIQNEMVERKDMIETDDKRYVLFKFERPPLDCEKIKENLILFSKRRKDQKLRIK